MKRYIGIDPGRFGAIAVVDDQGNFLNAQVMPLLADQVNVKGLHQLLGQLLFDDSKDLPFVILEKPVAMPGQNVKSTLGQGVNFGYCEMALGSYGVPYETVVPSVWTKVMHQGISAAIKNPKLRSALKAQHLLGLDPLTKGKAKKPHEGLVDAYLLAVYAYRKHGRGKLSA